MLEGDAMVLIGMISGILIFSAGIIIGLKLEKILSSFGVDVKLRKRNPFEGKNGLLSYRHLKYKLEYDEDDEE